MCSDVESRSGAIGDHANNRCVAWILEIVDWWHSVQEPERSGCLYQIQASRLVRDLSTLVILANAVSITLLTDPSAATVDASSGFLESWEREEGRLRECNYEIFGD